MEERADPKRQAILASAFTQFSRYGFRRTSMEDIAKETGTSRASLYSYFENKEAIFRGLAAELHERSLGDAEGHLKAASGPGLAVAQRVEAALIARLTPFQSVVSESAHGSEIYDENNRLCGDLVLESSERFRSMLATALSAAARAGEIDLKSARLTASAAAELVHLGATGLKQGALDVRTLEKRIRAFVQVFFAGLRG